MEFIWTLVLCARAGAIGDRPLEWRIIQDDEMKL